MKSSYFAFLLLALIACSGTASSQEADTTGDGTTTSTENHYEEIPIIPGDNSHYVEGKSRYIWFPDGDRNPHLVDLKEAVNETTQEELIKSGSLNQYWLYTRQNPTRHQLIINENDDSIKKSNYLASRPTFVISHGWLSSARSEINILIKSALLANQDCNVIVLDWSVVSHYPYGASTIAVPSIGSHLGFFLIWLMSFTGSNWNTLHLAGHSLGAHVVGNAGRTTDGRPIRVDGLDPAGPLWTHNKNAIDTASGKYVEITHTDGNVLGLFRKLGHADFYPNGGKSQPGCLENICSHLRAYELFAATIRFDHLAGKECKDIKEAAHMKCSGRQFNMGNAIVYKSGSGIFGLSTEARWPYDNAH